MAIAIIHIILMQLENIGMWVAGKLGIPLWVAVILSILIIYLFWKPLFALARKIFNVIRTLIRRII